MLSLEMWPHSGQRRWGCEGVGEGWLGSVSSLSGSAVKVRGMMMTFDGWSSRFAKGSRWCSHLGQTC